MDDWVSADARRFVLFLPVLMGAGVLLYFTRATEPPLLPALALAASCLLAAAAMRPMVPRAVLLCLGFIAGGFASAGLATWRAPPWVMLPRGATLVSGTVTAIEALPAGRRMTIGSPALDGGAMLARGVRIRLRDTDAQALAPGDVVQVRALLQPPPPPAYPGGWDTQRDAFFAGMGGYGFAIGEVRVLRAADTGRWQALRESVAARVMAALPGAPGAMAATLLTGLGGAIPAADRQAFQTAGLAHLLAVAGLHIGIVMGLFFSATRLVLAGFATPALYWPTRRIAALTALAAGGLYMALTGAHVPILRSFAMASLVTLGMLTGRRAVSLRALALAGFVLLLWTPQALMGVSFQMSFAAVLALVAGYQVLRPAIAAMNGAAWWRRPMLYSAGLALTSLLAGTASLPFAAYHFGNATLFYVPANMLAVPLTAFWVMPWCLVSLILMPFGWESLALAPAGWGITGLIAIAHVVADLPGASVPVAQIPGQGLVLVTLGMAWLGLWQSRLRLAGVVPLALGLAAPLMARAPDVLVGPDAHIIAARVSGFVLVERGKRAVGFETAAAARVWGQAGAPFPAAGEAADGAIWCDSAACRFLIHGRRLVVVRDGAHADCQNAVVALSTGHLGAGCVAPIMLDQATARVQGAVALFIDASGVRRLTDRDVRGDRPWVFVARPVLPPARTE